jgi:Na+:H+ antiporter, NhaA family
MFTTIKSKVVSLLQRLVNDSKFIGILLISCTFISLLLANLSSTSSLYISFWQQPLFANISFKNFGIELELPTSISSITNEFLMLFFFLLIGLEIKREFVVGELQGFKKAILPVGAAIGGIVVPAILFYSINSHSIYKNGWAIPTATDIAFAIGIASLFGKKVSNTLKLFLAVLAIIDDLGAVFIITLFYGGQISWVYILASLACCALLYFINISKNKNIIYFLFISILLWFFMLQSGIHASIAGVLIALFIPSSITKKFEIFLHKPVHYFVIPLFVLVNTAIYISSFDSSIFNNSLSIGIIVALVLGKPLGIFLASFILVKSKIAELPSYSNWQKFISVSFLAGIGFTMSIFICNLSFSNATQIDIAKISVIIASVIASIIASILIGFIAKK